MSYIIWRVSVCCWLLFLFPCAAMETEATAEAFLKTKRIPKEQKEEFVRLAESNKSSYKEQLFVLLPLLIEPDFMKTPTSQRDDLASHLLTQLSSWNLSEQIEPNQLNQFLLEAESSVVQKDFTLFKALLKKLFKKSSLPKYNKEMIGPDKKNPYILIPDIHGEYIIAEERFRFLIYYLEQGIDRFYFEDSIPNEIDPLTWFAVQVFAYKKASHLITTYDPQKWFCYIYSTINYLYWLDEKNEIFNKKNKSLIIARVAPVFTRSWGRFEKNDCPQKPSRHQNLIELIAQGHGGIIFCGVLHLPMAWENIKTNKIQAETFNIDLPATTKVLQEKGVIIIWLHSLNNVIAHIKLTAPALQN
jgi:hypothetical protein